MCTHKNTLDETVSVCRTSPEAVARNFLHYIIHCFKSDDRSKVTLYCSVNFSSIFQTSKIFLEVIQRCVSLNCQTEIWLEQFPSLKKPNVLTHVFHFILSCYKSISTRSHIFPSHWKQILTKRTVILTVNKNTFRSTSKFLLCYAVKYKYENVKYRLLFILTYMEIHNIDESQIWLKGFALCHETTLRNILELFMMYVYIEREHRGFKKALTLYY